MKSNIKIYIVLALIFCTIILSYTLPTANYVGTNFISKLTIPIAFSDWKGRDVTDSLNINTAESLFNFINEARAHEYSNSHGKNLIFIVIDAGNFHHPKVCFTGAGYEIEELNDTEFLLSNHSFKAHTLFTKRGDESFLSFYWIVIDKNLAHQWIEQKIKQLYFSIFNKKRIGLMVRIDIPTKKDDIQDAMSLARQFVTDLNKSMPLDDIEYIFSKK